MIFAWVLRHINRNMHQYTDARGYTGTRAHTHTLTHTSLYRVLLQLFISPWHFEACSYLSVSLPPNPYFSFAPLLLHFMHFCLPSSFLPLISLLSPLCAQSVIKYFIMSLWTKWNVALPSSCTFFFLLPCSCCITGPCFLNILPAVWMQPRCNSKPFLQVCFFVTFPSWLNICGDFWVQISHDSLGLFKSVLLYQTKVLPLDCSH